MLELYQLNIGKPNLSTTFDSLADAEFINNCLRNQTVLLELPVVICNLQEGDFWFG